jgi:hypothetical protein
VHRVAFAIDQRQDFYLSLAFVALLRGRDPDVEAVAVLLASEASAEFAPHLGAFDRVVAVGTCAYPQKVRAVPGELRRVLGFRRAARGLALSPHDALVAYSFRELVVNVLVQALEPRPRLVAVRKCDQAVERLQTRKRPFASLHRNAWNRLFGASAQRYRWLPGSNRIGSGTYLANPFDHVFCLDPAQAVEPGREQIPYPFPVLRARAAGPGDGRPTIVVLGEKYPLEARVPTEAVVERLNAVLRELRRTFPEHRLVFKPRGSVDGLGLELEGWDVGYGDVLLEGLLLEDPAIEKVLSFKSSGSFVAALYGCEGYLLYPLLDLPGDFRAAVDAYFEPHRGLVRFVGSLEDLHEGAGAAAGPVPPARIAELCAPFLDVLLGPPGAREPAGARA